MMPSVRAARRGVPVVAVTCCLVLLAACGVKDFQAHPTGSPKPSRSARSERAMATPTAVESPARNPSGLGVRRGHGELDWIVNVAYRDGRVIPPAGKLDVRSFARITVTLASDQSGQIAVGGHKAATARVPAGGSGTVTFTGGTSERIRVELEDVGVLLLVVRVD